MLNALLLLGRAGVPPSIGDDDGGRLFDPRRNQAEHMLDPLAVGAVLYGREDFKSLAGGPREETLWLLGGKGLAEFDSLPSAEPSAVSTALVDSGLFLMAEEESGQQLLSMPGPWERERRAWTRRCIEHLAGSKRTKSSDRSGNIRICGRPR